MDRYELTYRKRDYVSLNGRIEPDNAPEPFTYPSDMVFILTDIIIQNRAPGDTPVSDNQYSRLALSGTPDDFFLTVVGNRSLIINFTTGIKVSEGFRLQNMVNSTAPFIEYIINGFLSDK